MLWTLGVFSGVDILTFLVEMTWRIWFRVWRRYSSSGKGRVGMLRFQQSLRAMRMR